MKGLSVSYLHYYDKRLVKIKGKKNLEIFTVHRERGKEEKIIGINYVVRVQIMYKVRKIFKTF